MMLPVFVEKICSHRGACAVCRNETGGADWRAAMQQAFAMPIGWPECPIGLPWGASAEEVKNHVAPIPLTAARVMHGIVGLATGAVVKAKEAVTGHIDGHVLHRLAVCGVCKHLKGSGATAMCELCGCAYQAKVRNAAESCPASKWGSVADNAKDTTFAAAYVISLEKTPDRLRNFWLRFPSTWPYKWPQWFPAVDGANLPIPKGGFPGGCNHAQQGCRQSWLDVLAKAMADGVDGPLLVMEDDCQFTHDAVPRIKEALSALPGDWEILYLGGEHESAPVAVSPGIVRCMSTGRTHALVINPKYLKALHEFWTGYTMHVDWGLRSIASRRRFYAVDPLVAAQGANISTIRERPEPLRSWDGRVQPDATVGVKADIVSHHGDLGDLIYGLPAMRATGAKTLVLYPANITRRLMTPAVVEEIRPLLMAQSYIGEVRYADEAEGLDLSEWRLRHYHWRYNLAGRQLDVVGHTHAEFQRAWINVTPNPVARVVLARSFRYRNANMPWGIITEKYGAHAVFVGTPEEHADFCKSFGNVRYFPTKDYLALAEVIAGADLFVGNQSSPAALRFAMCNPIVLEVDPKFDNCHYDRSNATYIVRGDEPLPDLGDDISIIVDTEYGKMVVCRHDTNQTQALISTRRAYDHAEIEFLRLEIAKLKRSGIVIADVGANIGTFTVGLRAQAGSVLAFEPQRVISDMLARTIALNGFANVECRHAAVGDVETEIEIPQFDYTKPLSFGSIEFGSEQKEPLQQMRGRDPGKVESVKQITLDSLGLPRLDLLKIDVEGMESRVLAGALETIQRCRPLLFVEFMKCDRDALRKMLDQLGYEIQKVGWNYFAKPR